MPRALAALVLCGAIASGYDEPAPERPSSERPALRRAGDETLEPPSPYPRTVVARSLDRGLDWLAASETRLSDGSWPVPSGTGALGAPVAVSSLATLALMAGGNLPGRGEHGERVARGLDYILSRAVRDTADPRHGFIGGDGLSRMHGHGFATLTLAQGFAISPNDALGARLRDALHGAVDLIERTQGAEGGWMYEPRLEPDHEGSVTICLVSALRAARDAGLLVRAEVIARAEGYVRASQAESGLFRYTIGSDKTTLALTAAAVATLEATGSYDDPALVRGVDAITRALATGTWPGQGEFPHYERFYLALALWGLREREPFEQWFTDELQRLVASQNEDGSWSDSRYGDAYATAINCLVLALPDGTLPIFQR
jgi:hypothetical protein